MKNKKLICSIKTEDLITAFHVYGVKLEDIKDEYFVLDLKDGYTYFYEILK